MKKNIPFFMTAFLSCSFILSGCQESAGKETHEEHSSHSTFKNNGDIREETPSADILPGFLDKQPDEIKTLYAAAARHEDLLSYMPCYCGCGESAGHKDNGDCFINERKEDGTIVWDDHGTKCGVCLEIAAKAIIEREKGTSVNEVRQMIDEQYKEGYAEPTDTKLPGV
ncbi:PCYCGC motif-containing (lipo)protein [Metabacillus indicus]|uniref:PCYCGC motif-containing (lipo)protein n=1 Tax=Metabacillus indicus TaxID=246786 RepID=UPI002492F6AB|nr:PCYCGC motif-containing (lipo)protein [Metabacillus indicus]